MLYSNLSRHNRLQRQFHARRDVADQRDASSFADAFNGTLYRGRPSDALKRYVGAESVCQCPHCARDIVIFRQNCVGRPAPLPFSNAFRRRQLK